jgi:hypothetical protein
MNRIKWVVCTLSAFVLSASCTLSQEKTYEYRTIHENVLRRDMQTMADSLGVLAELYFKTEVTDAQRHDIVHKELNTIERIASGIGGGEIITNYSVINRYMGAFLYDVNLAREFANRNPPNFVPANRLMNSCLSCHASI